MTPHSDPATDEAQGSPPDPPATAHRDLSWFLRRELLSVPLTLAVVATLLVFGISPATLIFVALMTVLVLGWVWSGHST